MRPRLVALLAATTLLTVACLPSGTRKEPARGSGGAGANASASTSAPPSAAAPSGPPAETAIVPPTPTPAPTFLVVTVKRGDSLNTIAHTYGTTARSLAFWNRTTYPSLDPDSAHYDPGLLQPGWTLFLIPNLVYDEETGDPVDPSELIPAP